MALTDNIISYWKFDESSGNAIDSVGEANNGTLNTVTQNVAGKINTAYDFTVNKTSYVDCGAADGTLDITGDDITLAAWIYHEGVDAQSWVISKMGTGTGAYAMYVNGDDDLVFTGDTGTGWSGHTGDAAVPINAWSFVVATYNGTWVNTYVNGTTKGTPVARTGNFISTAKTLKIGWEDAWNSQGFVGKIDEVAVWDRALSDEEIVELYNDGDGLSYPFAAVGTNIQINRGDAWKEVSAIKINRGDAWKDVASMQINRGDAWKSIF